MDQITGSLNAAGNISGALNPVYGSGASALSELDDVHISNVKNLQILQYQIGTNKWVNIDPARALPFTDDEWTMFKNADTYIAAFRTVGIDFSNKIIDVHFNYPMVQLKGIRITYVEEDELGPVYDFQIKASYSEDVNDLKCLFSYRDKRSN